MTEAFDLFLSYHPEWLAHTRTAPVDGRDELVVSTDCTVAFAHWSAGRGSIPQWKVDQWERAVREYGRGDDE